MKLEFPRQILEKHQSMKFHENPSSGSRVVWGGQTDGRTDSRVVPCGQTGGRTDTQSSCSVRTDGRTDRQSSFSVRTDGRTDRQSSCSVRTDGRTNTTKVSLFFFFAILGTGLKTISFGNTCQVRQAWPPPPHPFPPITTAKQL
jgi:hypothetical protein